MDIIEFGKYLKKLRKDKELTLEEVASDAKISHAYLSQIENAKKKNFPSQEVLIKLARSLGVFYADLFEAAGYFKSKTSLGDDRYWEQLDEENYSRSVDVTEEDEPYFTDLNNLLTLEPEITYREIVISKENRELIITYLNGLFAHELKNKD